MTRLTDAGLTKQQAEKGKGSPGLVVHRNSMALFVEELVRNYSVPRAEALNLDNPEQNPKRRICTLRPQPQHVRGSVRHHGGVAADGVA